MAAAAAAVVAVVLTVSTLPAAMGWKKAAWLELRLPGPGHVRLLDEAVVELAPGGERLRHFVVDPPSRLGVVVLEPEPGLRARLVELVADDAVIANASIKADARWQAGGAWVVADPGLLSLPAADRTPSALRLTFERLSGAGRLRADWAGMSQEARIDANQSTFELRFVRKPERSGWIMLPAVAMDRAEVRLPAQDGKCDGVEAVLHLPASVSSTATPVGSDCRISIATGPANRTPVHILLFGCALAVLTGGLVGWAAGRFAQAHPLALMHTEKAARNAMVMWPLAATFAIWAIVHVAILFIYVHGASPDSLDYLRNGWAVGLGVDTRLEVFRTPFYPLFLAALTALFGLNISAIIVGQHVLVLAAALASCMLVMRRHGVLAGALAGCAVALSPFVALTANVVWTESVFAAVATTASVVVATARPGWRSGFGAGLLLAAASLVRPAGLILAVATLAWIALAWLVRRRSQSGLRHVAFAAAFCMALAGAIGPWAAYVHAQSGRWSTGVLEPLMAPEPIEPGVIWQRTESAAYATWLLTFYNHVVPPGLAANRPIGDAPLHFDWRYSALSFPTLFPVEWLWDQRYPSEMVRETWRAAPGAWLRRIADLTWYNATLRHVPGTQAFAQLDLHVLTQTPEVYQVLRRDHAARAEPGLRDQVLRDLARRFEGARGPEVSRLAALSASLQYPGLDKDEPLFRALRWTATRYYHAWPVIPLVALAVAAACLFRRRWQPVAALAWIWLVFAFLHAANGIAGERYAAVLEPQILILCAMLVPLARDIGLDLVRYFRLTHALAAR